MMEEVSNIFRAFEGPESLNDAEDSSSTSKVAMTSVSAHTIPPVFGILLWAQSWVP